MNKKKIFNDPIYGLIRFPHAILYDIIDHFIFQRLRRISQQALSHYVYPGALHTRFQHALGATHLMCRAIDTLRSKGVEISDEEYEAVCIAILLHDVGHGPFSHALEHTLANVHHEEISLALMKKIALDVDKDFSLAIAMFTDTYHRPFFHQLVSGQIDTDRMDYLTRDSFFSGVAEGIIGYDRLITMMHVHDDALVIEEKGIHSLEKFLMARRLMYWQVYLHKTVIAAEIMLISILKRAKFLVGNGATLPSSEELHYFLTLESKGPADVHDATFLDHFSLIDDMDILWLMKRSTTSEDFVFRTLCSMLLNRKLFKVISMHSQAGSHLLEEKRDAFLHRFPVSAQDASYFFASKTEHLAGYQKGSHEIMILQKTGSALPLSHFVPGIVQPEESRNFFFYTDASVPSWP
jgi:HD superfamily phosphohydrolase